MMQPRDWQRIFFSGKVFSRGVIQYIRLGGTSILGTVSLRLRRGTFYTIAFPNVGAERGPARSSNRFRCRASACHARRVSGMARLCRLRSTPPLPSRPRRRRRHHVRPPGHGFDAAGHGGHKQRRSSPISRATSILRSAGTSSSGGSCAGDRQRRKRLYRAWAGRLFARGCSGLPACCRHFQTLSSALEALGHSRIVDAISAPASKD